MSKTPHLLANAFAFGCASRGTDGPNDLDTMPWATNPQGEAGAESGVSLLIAEDLAGDNDVWVARLPVAS
jgi:hypothetical protein